MKLALLGPPGAGKGTMAAMLIKEFGFKHIYPGGLLRKEIRNNTAIGKKAKRFVDNGLLVPGNVVVELVAKATKGKKHYIIDGFPRSMEQVTALGKKKLFEAMLYLDIEQNTVIPRFTGRRVCPTGHVYHVKNVKPKRKGICDIDGLTLIRRKDDDPKTVRTRFRVFHNDTEPVLNHYQKRGMLQKVDASGSPEEEYKRVKRAVKKFL